MGKESALRSTIGQRIKIELYGLRYAFQSGGATLRFFGKLLHVAIVAFLVIFGIIEKILKNNLFEQVPYWFVIAVAIAVTYSVWWQSFLAPFAPAHWRKREGERRDRLAKVVRHLHPFVHNSRKAKREREKTYSHLLRLAVEHVRRIVDDRSGQFIEAVLILPIWDADGTDIKRVKVAARSVSIEQKEYPAEEKRFAVEAMKDRKNVVVEHLEEAGKTYRSLNVYPITKKEKSAGSAGEVIGCLNITSRLPYHLCGRKDVEIQVAMQPTLALLGLVIPSQLPKSKKG